MVDRAWVAGIAALCVACFSEQDPEGSSADAGSATMSSGTSTGAVDTSGTSIGSTSAPGTSSAEITGEPTAAFAQPLDIATDVETAQSEFPLRIALTPSRFAYADAAADGSDVRVVVDLETAAPLPLEIEHWEPGGNSELWVRVPSIGADAPTRLWLVYGAHGLPVGPPSSAVWSEQFAAVWHFSEPADGLEFVDATDAAHVAARTVAGPASRAAGVIGGAVALDGDEPLLVPEADTFDLTGSLTVQAWIRADSIAPGSDDHAVFDKPNSLRLVATRADEGGPMFGVTASSTDAEHLALGATNAVPALTWTHLAGVLFMTDELLFVDGTLAGSVKFDDTVLTADFGPAIGGSFAGRIDELRISSVARSDAWMLLDIASMRDEVLSFGEPMPWP